MLKAGYVEDWPYHKTYSGTPQGGIVSPILANIYLHEFDKFMEQKKQEFDQGTRRQESTAWSNITKSVQYHRRQIGALKGDLNPEAHTKLQRYEQKVKE